MNSFCNNDSLSKKYYLTLVKAAAFFLIMNLAFKYVSGALNSELVDPGEYAVGADILSKSYIWSTILFIATGVLYSLLSRTKKPGGNRVKTGAWRIDWVRLIALCASVLYFLWRHDISHPGGLGISIKGYSLILMFIFGDTIATSFYKKAADERTPLARSRVCDKNVGSKHQDD